MRLALHNVGRALLTFAAVACLTVAADGCFLRKYVYRPVLVTNAIGDSTTTLSGTRVHVYRGDDYELYGPTTLSVSVAEQQINRADREFTKHFGVQGPPMAIVTNARATLFNANVIIGARRAGAGRTGGCRRAGNTAFLQGCRFG